MSGENELDMSAYPVLRLDEIALHYDQTLRQGILDCQELLASLEAEDKEEQLSMIKYLSKQLDIMRGEIAKRNAQRRIDEMLSGKVSLEPDPRAESSLRSSSRGSSGAQRNHNPANREITSAPVCEPSPDSSPPRTVLQVPLPSELRMNEHQKEYSDFSGGSAGTTSRWSESARGSEHGGIISSNSSPSLSRSHSTEAKKARASLAPSRQSVEALNNSFGMSFVVGATERKKRYVQKKVVINPEEEKEKSRQNRLVVYKIYPYIY